MGKAVAEAVTVGAGVDVEVAVQVGDGLGEAVVDGSRVGLAVGLDTTRAFIAMAAAGVTTVVAAGNGAGAAVGAITAPVRYAAASSFVKLR